MKTLAKVLLLVAAALAIPACGSYDRRPSQPSSPGGQQAPSGPTP
jgi:hypothetical protein